MARFLKKQPLHRVEVDFLRRSKLMNRDAFLSRREDQSLRLLCRKVLSLWWQERGLQPCL